MIRIVTDSCAALTPALVAAWDVRTVPLTVSFGEEEFADGVELSPAAFYDRLRRSPVRPRTSQPAPGVFTQAFLEEAAAGAQEILCLTLSARLSGTWQAARQGAELARAAGCPARIEVFDTRAAAGGQALLVREAVRGARSEPLEAVLAALREAAGRLRLYGFVPTLEYLVRGGRVGRAAGMLGQLFGFCPLITLQDGEVAGFGRVRGVAAARQALAERFLAEAAPGTPLVVMHAAAEREAQEFLAELKQLAASRSGGEKLEQPAESFVLPFTPVLGTHTGPGLLGIAFFAPSPARGSAAPAREPAAAAGARAATGVTGAPAGPPAEGA